MRCMLRAMKAGRLRKRHALALAAALGTSLSTSSTLAEDPLEGLGEGLGLGEWTFHPFVDLRLRAEYRRDPVDSGGDALDTPALQADAPDGGRLNTLFSAPRIENQWFVGERTRVGLAVARGPLTAKVSLQDARVAGEDTSGLIGPGQPSLPSTEPYEAFLDVRTLEGRPMYLRLGRQRVHWGDGRLLGDDDDSPTGRHLDAARAGVEVGDFDFEVLGALLTAPGAPPPEVAGSSAPTQAEGSGAQLYGLDVVWHVMPLLHAELTGLARFVREPHGRDATPGDTYVIDGRVFGDHRGFSYAVEGAYQLGRLASFGENRDISAFAIAGRAALETTLPWHLTFGAAGAYASGAGSANRPTDDQTRFDPILPDSRTHHGPAGFYAWSNLIEAGGDVSARPIDDLQARAGYRFVGLAEPDGRWSTGALVPVGSAPQNDSRVLGHQIDAVFTYVPWAPVSFDAAYAVLLMGDGGEAILDAASRPTSASHWVMLQSRITVP